MMIGAVSLNPYIGGYQYSGSHARTKAPAQNMQVQSVQSAGAASGSHAVSTGRSSGVSSLIGARSIAAAGQASGVAGISAGRAADPESPVQPVDAVSALQKSSSGSTNYMIPFLRKGMDPAELAVRMRMEYSGRTAGGSQEEESQAVSREAAEAGLPGTSSAAESQTADNGKDKPESAGLRTEGAEKATEDTECQTCKERKYQDGSNDPGVSFKTPGHIDPGQSASVVRGHEMEHVVNERAKARNEGRRVISQSVTMHTGICPECGRVYTAGGVTRTTTAAETKQEEQPKDPRWILAASA